MSYAKTMFLGNVASDPELRYTDNKMAICTFSIAVNRKYKEKDEAHFFDCVSFGKTAESIGNSVKKGTKLFLECEPRQETWTDQATQKKRSKISFSVLNYRFTQPKTQSDQFGGDNVPPRSEPVHAPAPQEVRVVDTPMPERPDIPGEAEDDIPF